MAGMSVTIIGDLGLLCLPVGPSSGRGFPDTARAAVATSIFQAEEVEREERQEGRILQPSQLPLRTQHFHLHLTGRNLVMYSCSQTGRCLFLGLLPPRIDSCPFLRKKGHWIGIHSTCCSPSGSGVESCLQGLEQK